MKEYPLVAIRQALMISQLEAACVLKCSVSKYKKIEEHKTEIKYSDAKTLYDHFVNEALEYCEKYEIHEFDNCGITTDEIALINLQQIIF